MPKKRLADRMHPRQVRMTEAQYAQSRAEAERAGLDWSAYVRRRLGVEGKKVSR